MELTADEKDMLAFVARNPDEAAWRGHYRSLNLPGHDSTDSALSGRIRRLRERPDAQLFVDQQEKALERNRIDAMKAADGAGWKVEEARQELAEETYRLVTATVKYERGRVEAAVADDSGKTRASSPQHIAKLVEVGERISARQAGGAGMTPEERTADAKRLGIVQGEAVVVPVRVGAPKPSKQEGKA